MQDQGVSKRSTTQFCQRQIEKKKKDHPPHTECLQKDILFT